MLNFLTKFFDSNQKDIQRYKGLIEEINALEGKMQKLKTDEFKSQAESLKKKLSTGASLDDILVRTFALVREASVRTLGLRPYDVQLMAALAFHEGKIAEQKTGEGKTLSAAPA